MLAKKRGKDMRKEARKRIPKAHIGHRYVGIKAAAATLDVSENHLRMCLNGIRSSTSLIDRVRKQFPALLARAS
jgi:predicted transcriptional regulator of viral defense system